jgi:predicted amidohydrolase
LKRTARDLKLWIVAGTLPLPPVGQPEAKAHACSLLIDEHGEIAARYDKLHLFDVDVADNRGRYRESDDYAHGSQVVVADTPVGRLGLSVCYDLRFPRAVQRIARCRRRADHRAGGLHRRDRRGALGGADSRAGHRDPVLCAGGRPGRHPSRAAGNPRPCGDRRPWGRIVAQQAQGEAVLLAERDSEEQASIRARMPVVPHRRFFPQGACGLRRPRVTMSQMLSTVSEQLLAPAA